MKCQNCNFENNSSAAYCKNCGAPLKSHKTCNSGHNYDASLDYCPYCPAPDSINSLKTQIETGASAADKTIIDTGKPRLKANAASDVDQSDRTIIYTSEQKEAAQSEPRKLVGWLVTFDTDPAGVDYRLTVGRHRIGRGNQNDIVINQPGISEQHAVLLNRAGKFLLQDSLSVNGTFVNGVMIEDKTEIFDGDIIRMGRVDLKLITV